MQRTAERHNAEQPPLVVERRHIVERHIVVLQPDVGQLRTAERQPVVGQHTDVQRLVAGRQHIVVGQPVVGQPVVARHIGPLGNPEEDTAPVGGRLARDRPVQDTAEGGNRARVAGTAAGAGERQRGGSEVAGVGAAEDRGGRGRGGCRDRGRRQEESSSGRHWRYGSGPPSIGLEVKELRTAWKDRRDPGKLGPE